MPLYDYQCDLCAHEEEVLQGINDERLTQCPKCKQSGFKRKVSAPAFTFKGGGWYKDLYASSPSGGKAETKSAPAASDAKPAASSTSTPAST